MAFKYEPMPSNPGVRNGLRNAYDRLLNETLPALRDQSDATVDEMAKGRERTALRDDTRAATRADLQQARSKGLS